MRSLGVDAVIVLLIVLDATLSWRRGWVSSALRLVSLLAGVILAALSYQAVGGVIAALAKSLPALTDVLTYGALVVLGQAIGLAVMRLIMLRRGAAVASGGRTARSAGAVLGGLHATLLIILGLLLIDASPVSGSAHAVIRSSVIGGSLLEAGTGVQRTLPITPSKDLRTTVTLLTANAEDDRVIQLGFTWSSGVTDQAAEQQMLGLVNAERRSRGLGTLTLNPAARSVARTHSRDMLVHGYFSHRSPTGATPFDRMHAAGMRFGAAGENLALAPSLRQAHSALMNSPEHRANILSPSYKTVGIGIIDAGPYGLMVTQDFTD